ncbi:hypothetical protein L550_3679 [Bordetella pertussis H973]|uniref:Uncharacterized protein n=1 Tax=Bordetella pertussis CHLA-26 TaxID=1331284 RepID=A0AAI9J1I0_BORPT|nr:hypothetical protein V483_0463 [Bordetella pertussis CHLA-11]ETH13357.1 hypothetical protein L574_3899 [Bordetella pertussis STO1-SEAT-0006]ETH16823.1 hypothetical protein L575_3918 [Bordetella pertussis STO1-SEAT-0007]ETH30274.1 hypothetical protein L566_3179 [Bordetella pertussis CHLA-26]ETH38492.1 hypothetical protein L547_3932 [Bordetella pertussis H918]ETH43747.1 hypothetical protein L549_3908 [Bordetella pertussis H939]ETH46047.1 hypothetical protein L548_3950 [Bordetella pertussis H
MAGAAGGGRRGVRIRRAGRAGRDGRRSAIVLAAQVGDDRGSLLAGRVHRPDRQAVQRQAGREAGTAVRGRQPPRRRHDRGHAGGGARQARRLHAAAGGASPGSQPGPVPAAQLPTAARYAGGGPGGAQSERAGGAGRLAMAHAAAIVRSRPGQAGHDHDRLARHRHRAAPGQPADRTGAERARGAGALQGQRRAHARPGQRPGQRGDGQSVRASGL